MYHFFVKPEQIGGQEIRITGSDVNHIRRVLRMRPGEQITVSSGEDLREYCCELVQIGEDCVTARILQVRESGVELPSEICLFQGIPKGDKMELIVQKAVELGACRIVPMATKRAVVRLDARKEEARRKRWNAVSESAAKQSGRAVVPEVTRVMTFAEAVEYAKGYDRRLVPYELAEGMERTRSLIGAVRPGESVAVFIGPEGGFEEQEIALARAAGIEPVTLGRRILRTETAGMAVLSILMFTLEERQDGTGV